MKQMIPLFAVYAAAIAVGVLLTVLIPRLIHKKLRRAASVGICVGLSVALCAAATLVYLSLHYSAEDKAVQAFAESDSLTVTQTDFGYFFDGKGGETALVFYPGAKVDAEAYAPLMRRIAEGGVDCFLLNMPMRMAILDMNAANRVLSAYHYDRVFTAGHSMGGVAAAGFATAHVGDVDGVVLLASYPTETIDDSMSLLSVYGSLDGVLDRDAYERGRQFFPSDSREFVIEGGNHAGFGCYGAQDGDNEAAISADEQQKKTAEAITEFCLTKRRAA